MKRLGIAASIGLTVATGLVAQKIRQVPIESSDPSSGEAMYQQYCAACHGLDGKGKGPASVALKMPATDLTRMALDNGGPFPAQQVMHTLGLVPGTTSAHGSSDMPVWGSVFRVSGQHPMVVNLRIYNLTNYLESIQDPKPVPRPKVIKGSVTTRVTDIFPGSGGAMYQAYCASCHGVDARGNGPVAPTLKTGAPDLTLLSRQNGGKYPELRVMGVLGWQRGTEAHGSKEMPVWGNLFREGHEDENMVHLRTRNLTRYLENLQR